MQTSETLAAISPALVAALGEIEGAAKKATNPHFKSKYANLEAVIDASRDTLTKHGLTVLQGPGSCSHGCVAVTTRIVHASGEWIESTLEIPLGKADPQGTGSAISYARRYSLMAMLNMPAVDDDGEAAQRRPNGDSPPEYRKPDLGPAPEGEDFWQCDGYGMSAHAAKKEGLDLVHDRLRHEASELPNREGVRAWIETNLPEIRRMPKSWRIELRAAVDERANELGITNEKRAA